MLLRFVTHKRRLLATVIALSCPSMIRAADMPPIGTKVGEMYPDFLLPKLDGGFGRLSDYRGRKVLLMHFASW